MKSLSTIACIVILFLSFVNLLLKIDTTHELYIPMWLGIGGGALIGAIFGKERS